jgi:hypothetical protein
LAELGKTKRQQKSEAALLDHRTNNLLRALKRDMLKKDRPVDRDKVRKDGHSERIMLNPSRRNCAAAARFPQKIGPGLSFVTPHRPSFRERE